MGFKVKIPTIAITFAIVLLCMSLTNGEIDSEFKTSLAGFRKSLSKEIFRIYGDQDFVISPLAIQAGLSMLRMGAEGQTAFQMDRFLGFANQSTKDVANNFRTMLGMYKDGEILKIANRIYITHEHEVNENFKYWLSKNFYSIPENIQFDSEHSSASYSINAWVASKTDNTITQIAWPEYFDSDTRLVLFSATHFKGKWATAFPKENTKEADFMLNKYSSIKVPMMETKATFQYGLLPKLFTMFIILPYEDSDLSMVILLPYPTSQFSKLERTLKNYDLQKELKNAKIAPMMMHVTIPKFKATFQNDLNFNLDEMGFKKMYSPSYNDFGEMLKYPERLTVSNVIQKTVFEIDEEGGANSETLDSDKNSHMARFDVFHANRPFFYAVINKEFLPLLEGTYIGK